MVDIHSIPASSHPSCREQGIEWEVTSHSRAGRSRHASGCSSATSAVAATQRQHSIGMAWTPPLALDVGATLATAHRLLNNPLSAHASPSSTEQWSHDVDQLIITTINTPHHEGGRHEPSASHSGPSSVERAPPSTCVLPSITMAVLCDELIHRCGGGGGGGRIVASTLNTTVKGAAT
jgi:hypothetical protein